MGRLGGAGRGNWRSWRGLVGVIGAVGVGWEGYSGQFEGAGRGNSGGSIVQGGVFGSDAEVLRW